MTGNHLIATVRLRADKGGHQHAVLLYAVCHLRHSFVLLDLERMIGEVGDVGGIQRDDLFKLRFRTAFIGGEQVIERRHP